MATFEKGKTVNTAKSAVVVDANLPVGKHRFQLVVVSERGTRSAPDIVTVEVQQQVTRVVRPDITPVDSPVLPTGPLGPIRRN